MAKRNRAYSPSNIIDKKFKVLDFDGEFGALIGKPELTGHWIIWGNSTNGKTDFCIKLGKYMCRFGKVVFNPLEEGISHSIKLALIRNNMKQVEGKFIILNREGVQELLDRLKKHKAPRVVIIDSFQYTKLKKADLIKLDEEFPNTLFIWISHAKGKLPKGEAADDLKYHAMVKIHIEGFRATCQSRYGGGKPYTIWHERAAEYHGEY